MIQYITYIKRKDIYAIAEVLLKNKLYINGYTAKNIFKKPKCINKLIVALDNQQIIGWSMIYDNTFESRETELIAACYVRPVYRRRKIGSMLINMLNLTENIGHIEGIRGSVKFWNYTRPERASFWIKN